MLKGTQANAPSPTCHARYLGQVSRKLHRGKKELERERKARCHAMVVIMGALADKGKGAGAVQN